MKITRRQLRRIIKEEKRKLVEIGFGSMEPFAPDYDTRDPLDDFEPIQLSYTNPQTGEAVSKPLYSNGEADDAFALMFSIDPNIKYSVDDIREGKHNMKITKRQLRRIITEATRESMINEGSSGAEIENGIQRALEMNPVLSGIDLIDHVMQEVPGTYHQRVEEYMDEMMESGLLSWDVEEDEWRLA
jgi:hypothetical protein